MVKVEVIEEFTLGRFDELKNIERKNVNTYGRLYAGDKFECEKDLADYLLGDNSLKRPVVKLIEIVPEKVEEVQAISQSPVEKLEKEIKKSTKAKVTTASYKKKSKK